MTPKPVEVTTPIPDLGDYGDLYPPVDLGADYTDESDDVNDIIEDEVDLTPSEFETDNDEENFIAGFGEETTTPRPVESPVISSTDRPLTTPAPETPVTEPEEEEQFLSLPGSIFACPAPGFYPVEDNCNEFYVCQEVLPGKLLADQVYRCPDRYLFDDQTRLCQREWKVSCNKFSLSPYNGASNKQNVLVVLEQYLEAFFSTPLRYKETRLQFGLSRRQ